MSQSAHRAGGVEPRLGLALLVGLIALVAAAKPILVDTLDPDCFWHLRVAEQLRAQLAMGKLGPLTDDLSFSSIRTPWTPYSWLAELAMEAVWRTGGWRSAIAIQSALAAAFVALIALACRSASDGALEAALAAVAATVMSLGYLSFRPVTFALILLAVCCWLIVRDRRLGERTRVVWLIVPLTALTINLHLYAIFVPLWIAALWIGAMWERSMLRGADPSGAATGPADRSEANRRAVRYTALLSATGLACLATPMLPGVIATAIHYQAKDTMVASGRIGEMQPFYHGFAGVVSAAIVLVILIVAFIGRQKVRVGDWIWLALALGLMFRLGRFAPQFAIVAAPVLAAAFPRLSSRLLLKPALQGVMALVLLGGMVRMTLLFPGPGTTLDAWLERLGPGAPSFPCSAARYVAGNVTPRSGRLINEFSWGGFLEWRFKGRYQTFLDGRTQLFSQAFWRATYLGSDQERRDCLSQVQADAAVLPAEKSVFERTLRQQGWAVVYEDAHAKVLVPPAITASAGE